MQAAFYKGNQAGAAGLHDRLIRWWCSGPYSHVELVFSDGEAASSSLTDGGVRFKRINFNPERWDLFDLHGFDETAARQWFENNLKAKYDIWGNLGFLWRPIKGTRQRWFCSEAVLTALGFQDGWRFCPNGAHAILAQH
ncbi:hypothetical protein [Cupriavidus sp. RAF12]|uniref:hypothetical protein n=1 Tax=Cupriavidus sp. RAF12 TaxID=3233050 RepID=UPI003F8F16C1